MPNAFLGIKQTILNECRRNNGIRRRQARELIKIDVNKTSRIWDLLKESGEVWVQGERPAGANANGTQAAAAAAPVAPAPAPAAAADAPPEAEP
ncbi:hypothetical protein DFJ74DRAFT_672710 [Hyaloraphidium curvatum]|nr:hypothetical protein DFJ74DRAFT_672710 [Hyaloraphidium curvatum]